MLSIGLTGGIAAGKSLLATRFKELGALVIDADQLARDVVAPGTPGLAAIVERFGAGLLLPDGSLNRPALGALVFAEPKARSALNGIVHPLVRAAAKELGDAAGPGDIVVQDIPLLVESGQGANFHLVVVVQAPAALRIERMVRDRGMGEADARARMAAQATDEQRAALADVVVVNDRGPGQVLAELDRLWHERILPFAANLANGVPAAHHGVARGEALRAVPDGAQKLQAARIKARLNSALGLSSAVGGQPAVAEPAGPTVDVGGECGAKLEFVVRVRDRAGLAAVVPALAAAGFPRMPGTPVDAPVHASADPGCPAIVRLQVSG